MTARRQWPDTPATRRILFASLIGTAVEFYDFYIYATAASLVFGPVFFPADLHSAELIAAYASFGIAFLARPIGGALFGHFGDKVGRKATLVASLLLMGGSTAAIGFLPTYSLVGWMAPALLCLMRFGQGLALGGEWTGAALLALENAPKGWRARFAMFAPLGAPVGFILANSLFLLLTLTLSMDQFRDWGWRVPFLASAPLVWLGLWVRLNLVETEEFAAALAEAQPHRAPLLEVVRNYTWQVLAGTFGVVACFSLYYTATAFALGYGTSTLGYDRSVFLLLELGAILFMAVAIVAASWMSDRLNAERVLILGCAGTIVAGVLLAPMLGSGSALVVFLFLAFSLLVMGFVNGPLGAWLPSLFPPRVRYSGTSIAFNIGGIIGGAFSPMISQALAEGSGLPAVGFYLAITGGISLLAFDFSSRRRAQSALAQSEKRYRSIFEQTHIPLCEMDFLALHGGLGQLRDQGVRDLPAHLREHPALLTELGATILVVDANDAAARLLGRTTRAQVFGTADRFMPMAPGLLLPMLMAVWHGQLRFEAQTQLTAMADRQVTAILVIAFPDDPAGFGRVSCAMIDMTERERAKEALLAAQEELARAARVSTVGAVSASIAHEVNQPIGAVVMNAQTTLRWLRRDPPNIEEAVQAAERAVRDAMRAGKIVQRTREQLRHQRRAEPIELQQVVREVLALLDRDLSAAGTTVRLGMRDDSAVIVADRVEMQQLLVNLVGNALHAMRQLPEARRILEIAVEHAASDFLQLVVRDHGTGIEPDHLSRLFNPFFTTKREGMGIGLSICKTIVEAYGGSMTAGNHEDGGAVFVVTLPAAPAGTAAGGEAVVEPVA
jgi:signal transduction histidine kinase/predicted MFS family arabinose efflux permease